jgi:hypothetical protein
MEMTSEAWPDQTVSEMRPPRISTPRTSRRQLLKALGVSAAAAPFVPALDSWAAGGPTKRLVTVFYPHGVVPENYWPGGTETAFTLAPNSILEPLTPHKADMIVFKNLKRPSRGPGEHERCGGNLWTGTALAAGSQDANGPSVDQIVAKKVGAGVDFESVQFGVQTSYWGENDAKPGSPNTSLIYAGPRARVYPELDPEKQFARLFGSGGLTGPGAANMGDIERTRAEKKSILDYVKAELMDVQQRVATSDRRKIDSHLELTRDIERRLQAPARTCGAVEKPAGGMQLLLNDNFPALLKVMNKLLVAAIACDRTRVASMQYSRSFSMHRPAWLGIKDGHHTLSHNTGMKAQMTTIARWYMQQVSDLLTDFKAVQEGGKPLLDNLLVVVASELCTPWNHVAEPSPNLFFGKAAGAVPRTGRCIDFANQHDHNQFLTTVCQAMGATDVNHVGDLGMDGILPGILT